MRASFLCARTRETYSSPWLPVQVRRLVFADLSAQKKVKESGPAKVTRRREADLNFARDVDNDLTAPPFTKLGGQPNR
jgi:hypothetical protein